MKMLEWFREWRAWVKWQRSLHERDLQNAVLELIDGHVIEVQRGLTQTPYTRCCLASSIVRAVRDHDKQLWGRDYF